MSVFSFMQQVARYEATYPSHEHVFIRATSCTLRGIVSLISSISGENFLRHRFF